MYTYQIRKRELILLNNFLAWILTVKYFVLLCPLPFALLLLTQKKLGIHLHINLNIIGGGQQ